jgi:hypothetical protein
MNLALRALGWAIRFFWIVTLAFAVTCVYSAAQINVELGQPVPLPERTGFGVTLPITLRNRGYYRIADLNVRTTIKGMENGSLPDATSYITEIHPQDERTVLHNIDLDVHTIIANPRYLFNDSELQLDSLIRLSYADLIPVRVETTIVMPWGAPLFNFAVGPIEHSSYDLVSRRVTIPISFQNHSPCMNVTGTMHIEVFNSRNQLLGEDTLPVDASPGASYSGEAEIAVQAAQATLTGEVRIYFETDTFHYGPVVTSYG